MRFYYYVLTRPSDSMIRQGWEINHPKLDYSNLKVVLCIISEIIVFSKDIYTSI